MRIKYGAVVTLMVLAVLTKCNTTSGGGDYSTDLPIGTVTEVTKDTGTTYKICVKSRYSDRGFIAGNVYCRGARPADEAQNCKPRANATVEYPKCKNP